MAAKRASKTSRKTSRSSISKSNYPAKELQFSRPNSILIIFGVILLAAVFYIGMLTQKINNIEKQQSEVPTPPPTNQPYLGPKASVPLGIFPALGDSKAKVTVVEFADFQCPYCERWFTTVEPTIINDYVKKGKVKFIFRNYAFLGQESNFAAEAAYCANDQGKFWDFHNYLYQHQGTENSGTFTKTNLEGFAQTLGLNTEQFNTCLDSDKYATAVSSDLAEGQKAAVQGTPTTFINGQMILINGQSAGAGYNATQLKDLLNKELRK